MHKILLTSVALLGFAFPAYASQDSGNTGLSNNGPFTTAQYTSHWDLRNHGAFASQDNGNLFASQDNGNLFASQDSGNLFASQDSGNLFASQDSGNLFASQDSGNLFASQDSGNLPDTLHGQA